MIEEIKAKIDIVDYIGRTETLKRVNTKFKCLCPFHHEKTPSFTVDPATQRWRCFGACGTGGDLIDFAMRKHHWTLKEAIEILAKEAGVEMKTHEPRANDRLYAVLNAACELYQSDLLLKDNAAIQHLNKRGIDPESPFRLGFSNGISDRMREMGYTDADLLNVGLLYQGEHGVGEMFRGRLIIPLFDERGRIVGFAARTLTDQTPKFINTPKTVLFDRSKILYGYHQAKGAIRSTGSAVVVEGYFDVIAAHQAGYQNVVAQMGTEMTPHQAKLVEGSRVIIALDGDSAGAAATTKSLSQSLKVTKNLLTMTLPEGDDPDDVIRRGEWEALVNAAVPALDYMIEQEARTQMPKTFPERQAAAKRMLEIVNVDDPQEAHYAVQRIEMVFGLPNQSLLDAIKKPVLYERQKTNVVDGSLEMTCIRSFLQHYAHVMRAFRSIDIPTPNSADFVVYPSLFSAILASIEQYDLDPIEYVQTYYPDFTTDDALMDAQALVSMLLHLRSRAIDDAYLETDEKLALMTQKAKLLAYQFSTHP